MTEEEFDKLIQKVRNYALEGHSASKVLRLLSSELSALQGGVVSGYVFSGCLFAAFELDFGMVQRALRWRELGWGGEVSDDDIDRLLAPLNPRVDT